MANTEETPNVCGLKREDFQTTVNGKKTDLFILRNSEGNEVAITNYGGALVAIMVPDRNGKRANVIMGHDNILTSSTHRSLISQDLSDASATALPKVSSRSTASIIR